MAISQAMCTSFKVQLLSGAQNFNTGTTKVYKIALYTSAATLGAGTTTYTGSTTGEVANGGGYTTGGEILTVSQIPTNGGSGTTAYIDFADVTWSAATITARGALIYNSTDDTAVAALDFGSDKTSTSGDFTIIFPTANATDAIIRIA
jgi:predicted enzyme related to lactoylglutathione lyase